jgi:hypothetical protein
MPVVQYDETTAAPALAGVSTALGAVAFVLMLTRPSLPVAVVVGTAGIVAAALGLAALRLRSAPRLVPLVGVGTGAATALVLVAALGLTLVDRPAPVRPAPSAAAAAAAAAPARSELTGVVNTLAYLLARSRDADGGWPASIAVAADGRVYATSGPNVGHVLVHTPTGTRLDYDVTDDHRRMLLTLSVTGDPAATVRYSSATGLSTNE